MVHVEFVYHVDAGISLGMVVFSFCGSPASRLDRRDSVIHLAKLAYNTNTTTSKVEGSHMKSLPVH